MPLLAYSILFYKSYHYLLLKKIEKINFWEDILCHLYLEF